MGTRLCRGSSVDPLLSASLIGMMVLFKIPSFISQRWKVDPRPIVFWARVYPLWVSAYWYQSFSLHIFPIKIYYCSFLPRICGSTNCQEVSTEFGLRQLLFEVIWGCSQGGVLSVGTNIDLYLPIFSSCCCAICRRHPSLLV